MSTPSFTAPNGTDPARQGDPIKLSEMIAALAATQLFRNAGLTAPVQAGTLVLDAARLRGYGAVLDGVADDSAAVQAAISGAATFTAAPVRVPSVVIQLPAGTAIGLGAQVSSGAVNLRIDGAGPNVCAVVRLASASGAVMWQHGSSSIPAVGYLHIEGVSFVDGSPQSGATGLSVRMGPSVAQKCFTLEGCAFRDWMRPVALTNLPRGYHVRNVTLFGTGPGFSGSPGFDITTTSDFSAGSYGGCFVDVMVANYTWGWRYNIQGPLEGQVFLGCNAYNGWGGWQVNCAGGSGYKTLLWSWTDCDWQGLGFGLDLHNCRQVTVRGGYWIANLNAGSLPTPNGDARRRYMAFRGCENVRLQSVEYDVLPGQDTAISLLYCDSTCFDVNIDRTIVRSFSTIYAGIELDTNVNSNVIREFGTVWQAWTGGPRILDAGNSQTCESVALTAVAPSGQNAVVTVSSPGIWDVSGLASGLTTDANGRVAISFPTRTAGGSPLFLGGAPIVNASVYNSTVSNTGVSIVSVSTTGFVVGLGGVAAGVTVGITYRARGV